VSSVPDEQSAEVGGLQNTVTNLGASIGTALTGAVLIATPDELGPDRDPAESGGTGPGQIEGQPSSSPAASRSSQTTSSSSTRWSRRANPRRLTRLVHENATARIERAAFVARRADGHRVGRAALLSSDSGGSARLRNGRRAAPSLRWIPAADGRRRLRRAGQTSAPARSLRPWANPSLAQSGGGREQHQTHEPGENARSTII